MGNKHAHKNTNNPLEMKDPISLKIAIIGSNKVGITSLINRYAHQTFLDTTDNEEQILTTHIEKIYNNTQPVHLTLQRVERLYNKFSSVCRRNPFHGVDGVVIVYDVCEREGFDDLMNWKMEVEQFHNGDVIFAVVGNKEDLEDCRVICSEEGKMFCAENGIVVFEEVSAKTGHNVEEMFERLIRLVIQNMEPADLE
eukprot:TRINITY_DN6699_c0_g1_i1.p1 TRINITY_DN6699_c0_g1~~TRINITY_DN6699_c0_g1_i1.p1  ORF type:complete len:197 (+),score=38.87 TRINITY_DN6699_c0_g1_i1:111-701(+)